MKLNPDYDEYIGLGPQGEDPCTGGQARYIQPYNGMLRFVERDVHNETNEFVERRRILQQFMWSHADGNHGWYDVPLVEMGDEDEST